MKKLIALTLFVVSASAFAAGDEFNAGQHLVENASPWALPLKYVAYFLAMAIAAYGGTKAQSAASSVALEGIARNPSAADKIQTPMILGLALMESLVIFTLISVFLI